MEYPDGLYDLLITDSVAKSVDEASHRAMVQTENEDLAYRLAFEIYRQLESHLLNLDSDEKRLEVANRVFSSLGDTSISGQVASVLKGLVWDQFGDQSKIATKPEIPLSELALLTNAKGEPALGSELRAELFSAAVWIS